MKIAGGEGCEIGPWGYMPNDESAVLKNAIDARGLTLVGEIYRPPAAHVHRP
ncbi:MAG: hypothetical protein IJL12_01515 [Selenomonadaceae bacterium]|nr:hypothetical protein [Selenomonadaceae bacterium]MBQ7493537.1 hypothetical protein [Selenomonadaceae bacterium]